MIHIVGLGGVGFWLTVGLSRVVPSDQLQCWDDDTLSGGAGAARLPWAPPATKKVELLRGFLSMVFADAVLPNFVERKFSGLLQLNEGDFVIDCTDMPLDKRKRMWATVRNRKARIIRVSYDGRGSTVVVSTGLPLMAPAAGGYAAVPSLSLSFAAGGIGAEAVKRYLDSPVPHFTTTLSIEETMK
jgi:hypothetical protein